MSPVGFCLPFAGIIEYIRPVHHDLARQDINFDLSAGCPIGVVGNDMRIFGIHPGQKWNHSAVPL